MGGLFSRKNKNLQAVKKDDPAVVEATGFKKLEEPVLEKAESGDGAPCDTGAASAESALPPPETIGAASVDDTAPIPESTGAEDSTPPPAETITASGEGEPQLSDDAVPSAGSTVTMSSKVGVSMVTKKHVTSTFMLQFAILWHSHFTWVE